jgi:hypothetical protein
VRQRAAVVAAAGTALLLIGTAARQAPEHPPAPTAGPGLPSPPIPWLTDADRSQAARILAADPRTRTILGEASYTVVDTAPWTTTDERRIGAVMTISLDAPKTFPIVEWPAVQSEWSLPFPHYRERTLPASATAVRDFDVRVDLNRGRLVSLQPRNAEKMTIAPSMAPWPPASGD